MITINREIKERKPVDGWRRFEPKVKLTINVKVSRWLRPILKTIILLVRLRILNLCTAQRAATAAVRLFTRVGL